MLTNLNSTSYKITYRFRPENDGPVVTQDEQDVISIKQRAHNEFKLVISLNTKNAKSLLALTRHKQLFIDKLELIDVDAQNNFTVIEKQLFVIENLKLSPLEPTHLSGNKLTLTLHLFSYFGAVDTDKITPLYL